MENNLNEKVFKINKMNVKHIDIKKKYGKNQNEIDIESN